MTPRLRLMAPFLIVVVLHGCATAPVAVKPAGPQPIRGVASWYGEEFAGRVTASGDIFDPFELTAAHQALPFGTIANVTNLSTGATVQVRINDRGPFVGNRIIDLSYAAARQIGLTEVGIGTVEVNIVSLGNGRYRPDQPSAPSAPPEVAAVEQDPPVVAFPLPEQVGSTSTPPLTTEDDEFQIEVIEERAGTPTRRRVSADGRNLETVGESGKPTPVPPPAPPQQQQIAVKYILQLGAFQSAANAETLRQKARRVLAGIYVQESDGLHRVRAGPFESRERALQVQERLRRADLPSLLLTE